MGFPPDRRQLGLIRPFIGTSLPENERRRLMTMCLPHRTHDEGDKLLLAHRHDARRAQRARSRNAARGSVPNWDGARCDRCTPVLGSALKSGHKIGGASAFPDRGRRANLAIGRGHWERRASCPLLGAPTRISCRIRGEQKQPPPLTRSLARTRKKAPPKRGPLTSRVTASRIGVARRGPFVSQTSFYELAFVK